MPWRIFQCNKSAFAPFTPQHSQKTNGDRECDTCVSMIMATINMEISSCKEMFYERMKKCIYLGRQQMKVDDSVRLTSHNNPKTNKFWNVRGSVPQEFMTCAYYSLMWIGKVSFTFFSYQRIVNLSCFHPPPAPALLRFIWQTQF